jgi:hypothetical protein
MTWSCFKGLQGPQTGPLEPRGITHQAGKTQNRTNAEEMDVETGPTLKKWMWTWPGRGVWKG